MLHDPPIPSIEVDLLTAAYTLWHNHHAHEVVELAQDVDSYETNVNIDYEFARFWTDTGLIDKAAGEVERIDGYCYVNHEKALDEVAIDKLASIHANYPSNSGT